MMSGITKMVSESFALTVAPGQPLAELIEAGRYVDIDPAITGENFPWTEVPTQSSVRIVRFGRSVESDQALVEFEQEGLVALTLPEQAAFGVQHSDAQRKQPLIALGSVWADGNGVRRVGGLHCHEGWRDFLLHRFGEPRPHQYGFLVRERQ